MSKPIYMTPAMREEVIREFTEHLDSINLTNGKLKYETSYYWPREKDENGKEIEDRVTVRFSKQAKLKQDALIREFSTEVGWHGLVHRDPDDQKVFHIDDIIVFPQRVTGSTVTPDQWQYSQWLMSLPDAEFNSCRYHGHSHVNMSVGPSGTDDKWQADTLKRMRGDGLSAEAQQNFVDEMGDSAFYIFMIWNKRGDVNVKVYDLMTNHFYEEKEVDIQFDDVLDLSDFLADAKAKVQTTTYTYQSKPPASAPKYPPAIPQPPKPPKPQGGYEEFPEELYDVINMYYRQEGNQYGSD